MGRSLGLVNSDAVSRVSTCCGPSFVGTLVSVSSSCNFLAEAIGSHSGSSCGISRLAYLVVTSVAWMAPVGAASGTCGIVVTSGTSSSIHRGLSIVCSSKSLSGRTMEAARFSSSDFLCSVSIDYNWKEVSIWLYPNSSSSYRISSD